MKIVKAEIVIENMVGFSPNSRGVKFEDSDYNTYYIPMNVLIRLYEGVKFDTERRGVNWDEFCDKMMRNMP